MNGKPKIALQLYSLHKYTDSAGLARTLADAAKIGYRGVEFAGYRGHSAAEIRTMLDDNGLAACGTHVGRDALAGDELARSCEFCRDDTPPDAVIWQDGAASQMAAICSRLGPPSMPSVAVSV